MMQDSSSSNGNRAQNVYRAGRSGAAWATADPNRSQSGTLTAARAAAKSNKPLRLREPKKAS